MRIKKARKLVKLEKNKITIDEVMIQSSLIMIRTVAETKSNGADVKFSTEIDGDEYNIDVVIKKVKEKLYLRICNYIKLFFDFASETDNNGCNKPIVDNTNKPPKMKKV